MNTTISSASRDIENGFIEINGVRYLQNKLYSVSNAPLISQEYTKAAVSFIFGFSSLSGCERAVFVKIEFVSLNAFHSEHLSGALSKSTVCTHPSTDVFREIHSLVSQVSAPPREAKGSMESTLRDCLNVQIDSILDFQDFFTT